MNKIVESLTKPLWNPRKKRLRRKGQMQKEMPKAIRELEANTLIFMYVSSTRPRVPKRC